MRKEPYPEKAGSRIWLSRTEVSELDSRTSDPERQISLHLGLHGLRTDEMLSVSPGDLASQNGIDRIKIDTSKRDYSSRTIPLSPETKQIIDVYSGTLGLPDDEKLIGVSSRTIQNWIGELGEDIGIPELSPHDLRRTWATDCYYSLSMSGVPVAEDLCLVLGGWKLSESGRSTFRKNYLGEPPEWLISEVSEPATPDFS